MGLLTDARRTETFPDFASPVRKPKLPATQILQNKIRSHLAGKVAARQKLSTSRTPAGAENANRDTFLS